MGLSDKELDGGKSEFQQWNKLSKIPFLVTSSDL